MTDEGENGEKTADCFYPINANSKEEILSKCKELGIDGIVSIGSDIVFLATHLKYVIVLS